MRAVIDRFEGDKAVILYGEDEEYKMVFPRKYLPQNVDEGAILHITIEYDEAATASRLQESMDLLRQLQEGQE